MEELRLCIAARVHESLTKICGGGIQMNDDGSGSSRSQDNAIIKNEHQKINIQNQEEKERWAQHLLKIAEASVSLSNGEAASDIKSNSNTLDLGKAHDVEIRTALSFFNRYSKSSIRFSGVSNKKRRKINGHFKRKGDNEAPISPLEIVSDLGLVRSISSPYHLATLLVKDLEDQLWQNRNTFLALSENDNAHTTDVSYSLHEIPPMMRADKSGMICMVTPHRVQYLYQNGRYPCSRCVKWCKGEKGLWWHEQREHGICHEDAMKVVSSTTGGDKSTALVLYQPDQNSVRNIATEQLKSSCRSQRDTSSIEKEGSIFDVVKSGDLIKLKSLRKKSIHKNFLELDKNGASLLHWSAGCGHLKLVKYLVEELSFDPNQPQKGKRSFRGRTPLHWSARNGHLSLVEYFVERCKIDINAKTGDGTTAFCWASWQGHTDIMIYLHNKGANTESVNIFGCNAALWSAQSSTSNLRAIKWLHSIGCDLSRVNSNGHGMLHKSAQRGKIEVCKWMLSLSYSQDAPFDVLNLMGPDAEQCFPSDLAGMEKHTSLAKWLASKEIELFTETFQKASSKVVTFPLWLKEGLENAKHQVNRVGIDDLWERGAGIRRVSASIIEKNPDLYEAER